MLWFQQPRDELYHRLAGVESQTLSPGLESGLELGGCPGRKCLSVTRLWIVTRVLGGDSWDSFRVSGDSSWASLCANMDETTPSEKLVYDRGRGKDSTFLIANQHSPMQIARAKPKYQSRRLCPAPSAGRASRTTAHAAGGPRLVAECHHLGDGGSFHSSTPFCRRRTGESSMKRVERASSPFSGLSDTTMKVLHNESFSQGNQSRSDESVELDTVATEIQRPLGCLLLLPGWKLGCFTGVRLREISGERLGQFPTTPGLLHGCAS
jgi:hypothetical protein